MRSRLDECLTRAYDLVRESATGDEMPMRTAAYEHAVRRTLHAMELRGY